MGRRGEALRHPRHTARNTHPQSEDRMTPLHAHATLTAAMHRMLADDPAAIRAALSQPPRHPAQPHPPAATPAPLSHPPPPSNRARATGAPIGAAIAIAATAAALWL